ncbi:unnamed protein product [Scytosiphon promiscuus]
MSDGIAQERLVLSEVHVGSSTVDDGAEVVSRYTYLTPAVSSHCTNVDDGSESSESEGGGGEVGEDSSDVVRRRKRPRRAESQRCSRPAHEVLTIVHRMATTLGLVGQQVWSAAFLLGDFVLTHEDSFAEMQVLELGAGPGVAGLIAARVARKCYLTDYHHEILHLLARNVEANRHLLALDVAAAARSDEGDAPAEHNVRTRGDARPRHGDATTHNCVAAVRELDWFTFSEERGPTDAAICDNVKGGHQVRTTPKTAGETTEGNRNGSNERERVDGIHRPFTWNEGELEGLCASRQTQGGGLVIIAADVIYDEGLTDALFDVLKSLMPVPRTCVPERVKADTNIMSESKDGSGESNGTSMDRKPPVTLTSAAGCDPRDSTVHDTPRGRKCRGHVHVEGLPLARGEGEAVLFLALEKRFNFSLAKLSVAATGYGALMRNVVDVSSREGQGAETCRYMVCGEKPFEGRRLPLSFQQCFRYQRSDAMELWEIWRRPVCCDAC